MPLWVLTAVIRLTYLLNDIRRNSLVATGNEADKQEPTQQNPEIGMPVYETITCPTLSLEMILDIDPIDTQIKLETLTQAKT